MEEEDLVYHYCTVETFQKIMEQQKIRLSDVEKSNDYAERRWLLELIGKYYDSRIVDETETLMQREKLYAACFSEKEDLLSQWRAYAMDGRGVAVGLVRQKLECAAAQDGDLRFLKICYDRQRQEQYARTAADLLAGKARGDNALSRAAAIACRDETLRLGVMKNPAFEEEQEWRLCMTAVPGDGSGETVTQAGYDLSGIQIYYSNHRLISYRDVQFRDWTGSWIRRIVLGPKCRLSVEDVKTCLVIWGYETEHIEICHSRATYR